MSNYSICFPLLTILTWSSFCFVFASAAQNITATQYLKDPEALISSNSNFKIGFFSPANSTNRYVGIWYNIDSDGLEVVWVANRENPLNDTSGVLRISDDGDLQVLDGQNKVFWSSNVSQQGNSTVAQLQDTGNLVLLLSASGTIIWQSFDHPTDSWLPQVKFTVKEEAKDNPVLRSWKGPMDPSSGRFSFGIIRRNLPEFFTLDGDRPYWRSGPWNGYLYLGIPFMNSEASTGFNIIDNHDGTLYVAYSVVDRTLLERFELNYDGRVIQKFWNDDDRGKWEIKWQSIESECDVYGTCGPFGSCNPDTSPICTCLQGFEPKNIVEWSQGNWTGGCVRRMTLHCNTTGGKSDNFLRLKHMKVPDYAQWLSTSSQYECRKNCLANCLCLAYAYYSGIGCMIWNGSLIDIQQFSGDGADLFIRLAYSELGKNDKQKRIIVAIVIMATLTLAVFMYFTWRWKCQHCGGRKTTNKEEDQVEFKDLPMFKFGKLEVATSNFSENKKLGEGGFGTVYKGEFEDGQLIAVKRLSRASGQGVQEFMNEVVLISKLQHRNLVRLLGCCILDEEKLLVYEYMPNKSLDALLFDSLNREHLDWKKRFNIIKGISRGLLYLHRDSRLRIIHRDLKPSNILLDEELNPKISDFGMARIFGTKQHQANTSRVVGTYGYISPEYAMKGRFSVKSDIYSFGVLLLEIVNSGKRNSSFSDDDSWSLLTYAWKLWKENSLLSLIDQTMFYPEFKDEILLCIQLGLLCVQEYPEDRPTISTFITMLDNSEVIDLPHPKHPGFSQRILCSTNETSQNGRDGRSVNYVSLTMVSGR